MAPAVCQSRPFSIPGITRITSEYVKTMKEISDWGNLIEQVMSGGRGLTILVIDNKSAQREIIARALWLAGCDFLLTESWPESWAFFEEQERDGPVHFLILCSSSSFDQQAFQSMQETRGQIPLLLLEESDQENDGATLNGPFDDNQLIHAISRLLEPKVLTTRFLCEKCPMGGDWFGVESPGSQFYLDRFQQHCSRLVAPYLTNKSQNELKIAVQELGQNAIEWGHGFRENMSLRMAYCLLDDRICIRISDQGLGFNYNSLPDTSDPIALIEGREERGKRPGGFGVQLSRKVMDSITYNDKGNVVTLEKHFKSSNV
jgi:serine/threonine-protein kinase RsbW